MASFSEIMQTYNSTVGREDSFDSLRIFEGDSIRQHSVTAHIRKTHAVSANSSRTRHLANERFETRRKKVGR